jgi:hypothetical protein
VLKMDELKVREFYGSMSRNYVQPVYTKTWGLMVSVSGILSA